MATVRVSATKARNTFFDLLNQIALGMHVVIVRDEKEVALMIPKRHTTDWKGLLKATKRAKGILKEYDPQDNPLRRRGAADFLGRWDRDIKPH